MPVRWVTGTVADKIQCGGFEVHFEAVLRQLNCQSSRSRGTIHEFVMNPRECGHCCGGAQEQLNTNTPVDLRMHACGILVSAMPLAVHFRIFYLYLLH